MGNCLFSHEVHFKGNVTGNSIKMPMRNKTEAKSYVNKLKRKNQEYRKNAILPADRKFTLYKDIKIRKRSCK
jgi:hypothetical protein